MQKLAEKYKNSPRAEMMKPTIGFHAISFLCISWGQRSDSFSPLSKTATGYRHFSSPVIKRTTSSIIFASDENIFFEDDEDLFNSISSTTTTKSNVDLSGATTRQFNLGYDLILSSYAGAIGFDEVVDWEYYDNPGEKVRNVVEPPPLDPTKPKRTRSSSGSVVRVFRAELAGSIASTLRSQGLEYRVLVKEFAGEKAEDLASAELETLGRLQSVLSANMIESAKRGDWANTASSRYLLGMEKGDTRKDDISLMQLMGVLSGKKQSLPFVGILGRLNLAEYENDPNLDPNEWYRALGVPPPKPNSIWIVYEYAGLSTLKSYSQPPLLRWSKLPPKKGIFGNPVMPPPIPPWKERANYVVKCILKKSLEGLAILHENGVAHRSIGGSSIILSTPALDKSQPASIYTTSSFNTFTKFADFGFAGVISESCMDESFRRRAKTFGVDIKDQQLSTATSIQETNFAIAEDLHALGFVFLGALLTTLAEPKTENYKMPDTDEDSLQRLLGEIFDKDIEEFREYCEAEDIWSNVVALLDENDGAGWELINKMCFARERAGKLGNDSLQLVTARGLLANPLFQ